MNNKNKKEFLNKYLKNICDVNSCLEELEKLNAERDEIIKLASSENPPKNILEMMKESEEKFEALLILSKELKDQSKKINEEI